MARRVFVTGGTGFIGTGIVKALHERGDRAVVLTRDAGRARDRFADVSSGLADAVDFVEGEGDHPGEWQRAVAGCDAAINLAGAPIAGKRWNAHYKQRVHDSRVETTRRLVEAIGAIATSGASEAAEDRPRVLVSASGIDYYPFAVDLGAALPVDEDDEVTEGTPSGSTFLARVCRNWEAEAVRAEAHGVRVATMRTGIVLGDDGALSKLATPFRLFAGGKLGSGDQWMAWIHHADAVAAYLFALDRDDARGPFNLVAPRPVRGAEFARALGRALGRPAWLPTPAFALRVAVGEFAEYILHGRRAVPAALTALGFEFRHPDLDAALAAIYD